MHTLMVFSPPGKASPEIYVGFQGVGNIDNNSNNSSNNNSSNNNNNNNSNNM